MTMMRRVSAMKFSRLMGGITHTRLLSYNTGTQQVGEAFVSKVPPCKSHYESATAAHRRKRPVVYPNSAAMLGFDGKDEGSGGAEEARSEAQQLAATSRVRSQAFRSRLECNNKSVAVSCSPSTVLYLQIYN